MNKTKIIGISGVTCAGKTTLAERLATHLGQKCVILSQDEFYRSEEDPNHEWLDISEGVKHQNWESMSSIDWNKFDHKLNEILRESASDSDRVVVIEGHLIFNYKPISDVCHKKFFLTLEKDECFRRRDSRTYIPKDPNGYFDGWVWPLYGQNLEIMKRIENQIPIEYLDGSRSPNDLFESVVKSLEKLNQ